MNRKLFSTLLAVCTLGIVVGFLLVSSPREAEIPTQVLQDVVSEEEEITSTVPIVSEETVSRSSEQSPLMSEEKNEAKSSLLRNVPFTVQAPFGEWSDEVFQNACEEASIVMAEYWLMGKILTKEIAKQEIISLSKFQKKTIGQSIDTSTEDTEKLLREYYGVTTSEAKKDITLIDIKKALTSGALIIIPADGRKLYNPNYKQPGPTTHMLVIIGYDREKKEFITNDSGTRNGKGYRYKEDILFEAIRDYPTGNHLPIKEGKKGMIVVRKE